MGALYVDPYAVIWWQSYTRRPALNPFTLKAANNLRNAVYACLHQGDKEPDEAQKETWAVSGQQRVVVWNGGHADSP